MADVDGFGITDGYHDVMGAWHATPEATRRALRAAMRATDGVDEPPVTRPVWVVRCGVAESLLTRCDLTLDDGTHVGEIDALPPDLPAGYHDLVPLDGGPTTRVIASPGRCHLPTDLRGWVWAVQLYAARSRASWGIGDLADLAMLRRAAADDGAWGVLASPMHAPIPVSPIQPSPYFPSSRRWLNPLHLRVDAVPGAREARIDDLAADARALLADRRIDRDDVWRHVHAALDRIWRRQRERRRDPAFVAWRDAQGDALEGFARFCALAERHGNGWSSWPEPMRHPDSAPVRAFAQHNADAVERHAWVQWLLHEQLRAGTGAQLITDLAVGVDPDGADAWLDQDLLALDVSVGAPPDELARDGQDWGLPPYVPWLLRGAGYAPLIELFRAALAGGGLRVDHVMGLFRLFWIPRGEPAAAGAYVRSPAQELLALLCIESQRAGAVVVGEDLGTVEDEVRAALHDAQVLSYRVAWFEDGPPSSYPERALAALTTHDLPTIAGVWDGSDAAEVRAIGRDADADAVVALRDHLEAQTGVDGDADAADVALEATRLLASAPSMLVAVTLDDALGVSERPNVPGTTTERPNWSLALPLPLEEAFASPGVRATVASLAERAR